MLNTSSAYFVFLAGVFLCYWAVARWRTPALAVVLAASYFFYARWDLAYLALIPATNLIDFLCGIGMDSTRRVWLRRMLLGLSLLTNLAILASLKYIPAFDRTWQWILPLGLSFYCFQALSYTLDVYRKDAKATRSILAYFAAVSFFPTILAGPIARVADLVRQFEKPKKLSTTEGGRALFLIGLGAMKKLLIADYLADNLVNRIFDFPKLYSGLEVLAGVYGYALQLYFDFSGYSDVAVGSALLLGFKIPQNFNMPYAAINIADFWRRWHISLSSWLRDYVYFSFPGLRGTWMPYAALTMTMVIGGIWHGATWNFLIWGSLHGLGLATCRAWQTWRGAKKWDHPVSRGLAGFWTLQFVCLGWIFFRATSLEGAIDVLTQIASLTPSVANLSAPILLIGAIGIAGHYAPKKWLDHSEALFSKTPFFAQAALLLLLAMSIRYVAATGSAPFVYTQF